MYQVGGTMSTRTDGNYFVSYIRKADEIKFSDKVVGSPYIRKVPVQTIPCSMDYTFPSEQMVEQAG